METCVDSVGTGPPPPDTTRRRFSSFSVFLGELVLWWPGLEGPCSVVSPKTRDFQSRKTKCSIK